MGCNDSALKKSMTKPFPTATALSSFTRVGVSHLCLVGKSGVPNQEQVAVSAQKTGLGGAL